MIPAGVEVFVALRPIDLRWSFDRLAAVAEGWLGRDARSGALFVFFGKRKSAIKVLFHDGSGLCLFYKRLDVGLFVPPEGLGDDAVVEVPSHVLDALLDGVDVQRKSGARRQSRYRIH